MGHCTQSEMGCSSLTVLVGPENTARLQALSAEQAPRLDYRFVSEYYRGCVQQWHQAPSGFRGPRLLRVGRSFLGNLGHATCLLRTLSGDSLVYATGETWGLPVALVGATLHNRRFSHIMYVHRVFSPAWLRFLHATRQWLAVDGWICVTQHQTRLLRQALGPNTTITVVSQGVDTRFFDPAKSSPTFDRPYLLSVGVEMRNYDLLFEVVRNLDINMVVKASSAWMAGSRSQLTSIPPNVKVITERLSYVELRDLYAGAGLVVVPLHETPQAAGITTILEGMAMGKCILATQSSGLPDVLVDRQTGWVVPPTAAGLQQAIATLWNEPDRRAELATAGQRAVRNGFTLEHHTSAVVDFLMAVAQGR